MTTEATTGPTETARGHLTDLHRQLADWLRARTGWPETLVTRACELTADVTPEHGGPVPADVELDHATVHVHVQACREIDLTTEVEGNDDQLHLTAHHGDVVLETVAGPPTSVRVRSAWRGTP